MKICEVDIFGDKYALRADMDDTFVRDLARHVDSRMREVANASPSATPLQIAVLTALDLASERQGAGGGDEGAEEKVRAVGQEVEMRAAAMLDRLSKTASTVLEG